MTSCWKEKSNARDPTTIRAPRHTSDLAIVREHEWRESIQYLPTLHSPKEQDGTKWPTPGSLKALEVCEFVSVREPKPLELANRSGDRNENHGLDHCRENGKN